MDLSEDLSNRIKGLDNLLYKLSIKEAEAVTELNNLHTEVFNVPIDINCPYCIQKAYKQLSLLTLKNNTTMSERKYELKPGTLLTYPAYSGGKYTNANLTDAIAAAFLKAHPEMSYIFSKVPKEDASAYAGLKFPQLQAKYKEITGNDAPKAIVKKTDLIAAIEAAEAEKASKQTPPDTQSDGTGTDADKSPATDKITE